MLRDSPLMALGELIEDYRKFYDLSRREAIKAIRRDVKVMVVARRPAYE